MKKLLLSLMSGSIGMIAVTSVAACTVPTRLLSAQFLNNMNVAFSDIDPKSLNNDAANLAAFNGGDNSIYQGVKGKQHFTQLLRTITNMLSRTHYLYSPSTYDSLKKLYVGQDEDLIDSGVGQEHKKTPLSTDALWVGKQDNEKGKKEFYKHYDSSKTKINTLEGLYDYARYSGGTGQTAIDKNDPIVKKFFDNFLGLDYTAYDSSFTKMTLNISGQDKAIKHDSDVMALKAKPDTEGKEIDFTQAPVKKTFAQANPGVDAKGDKDWDKTTTPFSIYTIGTEVDAPTAQVFEKVDKKANYLDENRIVNNWNFQYFEETKDEKTTQTFITSSKLVDTKDLIIKYLYDTNTGDADSQKYDVAITVKGIKAVYSPQIFKTIKKDGETTEFDFFAKWVLTGYQFNSKVDANYLSDANKGKPGYGGFSEMEVSDVKITEHQE